MNRKEQAQLARILYRTWKETQDGQNRDVIQNRDKPDDEWRHRPNHWDEELNTIVTLCIRKGLLPPEVDDYCERISEWTEKKAKSRFAKPSQIRMWAFDDEDSDDPHFDAWFDLALALLQVSGCLNEPWDNIGLLDCK